MLILRFWQRVGGTFCNFDTFWLVWQEKIPEQGWEKVDVEGVGETGEELKGNEVGDGKGDQQRYGWVSPEGALGA